MTGSAFNLIEALANRRGITLPAEWHLALPSDLDLNDINYPAKICEELGWPTPIALEDRPKPQDFPLLLYTQQNEWCLAEQWHNQSEIRIVRSDGIGFIAWKDVLKLEHLPFPPEAGRQHYASALALFRSALLLRKRALINAGVATIVINVIALATSLFSMQVYDRVIPQGGFSTLWVLSTGVALALLFDFLVRNARAILIDREAAAIDAEVSEYFFARMQSIRLDRRPGGIGTTAAQMRGLDQIRSMLASATLFVLADLPFAVFFMVVMAMLGGVVSLVSLVLFPVALSFAYLFTKLIQGDTAKSQTTGNLKNGLLVEALDASETIKANQGNWQMLARWNRLVENVDSAELRVRRWTTLATSTFNLLQQVAYVAIVIVGAYRVALGEMSMGGLIACTIISGRINGPLVAALPNLLIQWGYAKSSLIALDRILEAPSDHPDNARPIKLQTVQGSLGLQDVHFAYPGSRSGINVLKLKIKSGERIGLIGSIGSGKSTLLRLLAGLYAPHRGHIYLDGMDVCQIATDDLRRNVCYLPQDYRVISGTLRDNLTLGLPYARDDTLLEAAQRTGLIALINGHPMGLDLPISEGGRGLSGGQRTLVGLTRILLIKPPVLLLDEPTANLDQESEIRVMQALSQAMPSTSTLVLVTHKAQLLSLVNRLLVMADGSITMDGPNKTVIEALQKRAPTLGTVRNTH